MRYRARGWVLALPLMGLASVPARGVGATPPSSCFVSQKDAERIDGDGARQLLVRPQVVILTPCKGAVRGAALWIWFSPEAGTTQRRSVTPPSTLEQVLGSTPTVSLNEDATLWRRLNHALVADNSRRPGFSRFDSRYGMQLGGPVVPGHDLRLPLAAFRWNPHAALQLKDGAGKVTRLMPVDGRVTLPVRRLAVGHYSLVQGDLEASFSVPPEADLIDLRQALRTIDAEPADDGVRLLRRSILFSEHGFVLNLVSDHVQD